MDVSPSLNVSVLVRLGSVLFTTTSTVKTPGTSGIGLIPFGVNPQEAPIASMVWCPAVRPELTPDLLPVLVRCSEVWLSLP